MTTPDQQINTRQSKTKLAAVRAVVSLVLTSALLISAWMALQTTRKTGTEAQNIGLNELVQRLQAAHPAHIAILLLGTIGTIVATAAVFVILTRRYGHVGWIEMATLTTSAGLLNYLPLRPGLFGRLTYHKLVNRITVRDSIKALLWSNALILFASLLLLAAVVIATWLITPDSPWAAICIAMPIPLLIIFAIHAARVRPESDPQVFRPIAALAIRYAELHCWALRFWAGFAIVGVELPWPAALALAGAHTFALMIPVSGNGLGLSEWFLGFAVMVLPIALVGTNIETVTIGIAAGFIVRGAEILVLVPTGLAAGWFVRARVSRLIKDNHAANLRNGQTATPDSTHTGTN